jgi:hypothetical protein
MMGLGEQWSGYEKLSITVRLLPNTQELLVSLADDVGTLYGS